MEFKIIAPGSNELEITYDLPSFKGFKLPSANSIAAKAHFGEMVFQHFKGEGFDVWYSNYFINHNTELIGRGDVPVLELHIQFLNQFDIIWDGVGQNTLRPYQYNLSYTPFLDNKAKFLAGREYHTFDIHFSFAYLERLAPASDKLKMFLDKVAKQQPASISDHHLFLTPRMIAIINRLLRCDFKDGLNQFFIESHVLELITRILDHLESEHTEAPIKLSSYEIDRLTEAKQIILSDYEEKITLAQLSRKVGLNEFKLKKGFKYLFGAPVFAFRRINKMEKAKELILNSSLSADEIAYLTGFDHPSNFNKAFKKHFLYTPAELKKYHIK